MSDVKQKWFVIGWASCLAFVTLIGVAGCGPTQKEMADRTQDGNAVIAVDADGNRYVITHIGGAGDSYRVSFVPGKSNGCKP